MTNPWSEQQPHPETPPDYPLYNPPTAAYPDQAQTSAEPYFQQPDQPPQPTQSLAPYQQPGYQQAGYYQTGGYQAPPDNYLVWAILSTVFCFLPLGVVSIVYSAQVNSKWAVGDYFGAQESARKARTFAKWSALTPLIIYGVLILIAWIGWAIH